VSLKDIPETLKHRGGLANINLFIRSCYVDIYDEITSNMSNLNNHKQSNFAVIGTAGIGKSGFFLYFLWRYMEDIRLMNDKNGDKSFFYQTSKEIVTFFHHIDGFKFNKTKLNGQQYDKFSHKKYPLFVDMEGEDYPFENPGLLIIFSSFKSGRYKERTKKGFIKLMPTWSYKEMSTYIMSNTFGTDFEMD
jgi:hypothetical protein